METPSKKTLLTNEIRWKEDVLNKYDIFEDLSSYEKTVSTIGVAMNNLIIANSELRANSEDVESIKAKIQLECLSAVDATTGKPPSNDTARRAILDSALASSGPMQKARESTREIQERIDRYRGEIEYENKRIMATKLSMEHKIASIKVLGL